LKAKNQAIALTNQSKKVEMQFAISDYNISNMLNEELQDFTRGMARCLKEKNNYINELFQNKNQTS
jgi:Neuraminidase (sialidase)